MVHRLRKLHRIFFSIITLLLPLLIWSSLYFRISEKNLQEADIEKPKVPRKFKHFVYMESSIIDKSPVKRSRKRLSNKILIDILANRAKKASRYALVLTPAQDFKKPDVLAYLMKFPLKGKGNDLSEALGKGILLGEMAGAQRKIFSISKKTFKKNQYLVIYSQAYSEIIEEVRLPKAKRDYGHRI